MGHKELKQTNNQLWIEPFIHGKPWYTAYLHSAYCISWNLCHSECNRVHFIIVADYHKSCRRSEEEAGFLGCYANVLTNATRINLVLYLLVSSTGNFCKQFGPRSGPTKCRARSGSKLFDTLMVLLKVFFEKVLFEKISRRQKIMKKLQACQVLI